MAARDILWSVLQVKRKRVSAEEAKQFAVRSTRPSARMEGVPWSCMECGATMCFGEPLFDGTQHRVPLDRELCCECLEKRLRERGHGGLVRG